MSPTTRHTDNNTGAADLLELLAATATTLLGKADAVRKHLRDRNALGELSDRQLRDVGIERQSASRPMLEVEAGLMTSLMAMR